MSTIFSLFMVLIIIACVLLIIVIMAQNPKGGGLSGTFGGSSSASFGVQRTNEFMDKATWSLGAFIIVLIMLSVILTGKPSAVVPQSQPTKKELPNNAQAPVQKPSAEATQTQQSSAPAQTAK
ncbi:preprotein translocase subunit SecG [Elizabethkingia meningoseptica]|uniref:Protein-export membrane protein SecG n=1 Tax=Elizabethkingia meningoseptica TaxID=238 RepID=A0A1V3TZE0_ELIME|nr:MULTISPECIES: preprotein translocase subunit SecG [Elizabethkingia]AQX10895.1 preprotein translocase subunit SecG [Elizabethkingia meningoseptica]MBG0512212.1 preprotein translocase subunit SecG [Elizabethkingia meningoseptica]MCL1674326.1 preprotein translocase subunit SecG [Elizabethkingia meningoseptica]MCL1686053.1 preprotein translocase subunit SecG [Elizabethkingia meningoseptica]MDE5430288.1 preprotein translocase subunit SecG [Elizabethkingia meningoseptica]